MVRCGFWVWEWSDGDGRVGVKRDCSEGIGSVAMSMKRVKLGVLQQDILVNGRRNMDIG